MDFSFNSLLEDPSFKFIFHEVVCLLGILYYLVPTVTRLREKKAGLPFTTSWKSLKNIVALYVVLAESVFLYEDIKAGIIIQTEVATVSQVLAVAVIFVAYLVLRDPYEKKVMGPVTKHKWSK